MEGIQLRKKGTIKTSLKQYYHSVPRLYLSGGGYPPLQEVADPH